MNVRCAAAIGGLALVSVCAAAQAQTPTKAQQDAIRSNCRSDYMSHCSSVTPGGKAALECLMQNKAKVSAGCQGALNAISAPAVAKPEPKPEPKAAAPKPEPAPAPAAAAPAPHSPSAAAPAAPPPKAPAAKKPSPPVKTVSPARPQVAPPPPPAAAPAPAAVTAAPPPQTHQPKLGEAILIRRFCTTDFRVLCKGVPLGQGRAVQCLANNAAALSPGCRDMMMKTGELR